VDIKGGERGGRIGLPSFSDTASAPFGEFRNKSLTLKPHLHSQASHMFDKIK